MTLAYHDTFAGLVPCRILAVGDWNDGSSAARIQYTAARSNGAYMRGDIYTVALRHLVPRNAIFRRAGCYMIRRYRWPNAERTTL